MEAKKITVTLTADEIKSLVEDRARSYISYEARVIAMRLDKVLEDVTVEFEPDTDTDDVPF